MKIFMIRHGKADYTYGNEHNFIGHGNDLAKLDEKYIENVIKTSKDKRLKEATLIVSSPYTRALQTAAIISKETGLDIKVEPDLREWEPDITYQYSEKEMKKYYKEYNLNNGIPPKDKKVKWESKAHLKSRIESVIQKYSDYKCIIFVFHQMAIKSIIDIKKITPAEIIEVNIKGDKYVPSIN